MSSKVQMEKQRRILLFRCRKEVPEALSLRHFLLFRIHFAPRLTPGYRISRIFTRRGPTVFRGDPRRDLIRPWGSVMVHRIIIQMPGLHTVMLVAEGLPVGFIPEQIWIAAVRFDVVNVCGLHIPTLSHAFSAQRMCIKKASPGFPPCRIVATRRSRSGFLWMKRSVHVTVFCSRRHKRGAAGVLAGYVRF